MTVARFWADDFDMDLPKILPNLDQLLGDTADIPLWTHGHSSYGRLNHPSVWHDHLGMVAFFGFGPDTIGKPASHYASDPPVECTWREVVRDAWPHQYLIVVNRRVIWNTEKLWPAFQHLMDDLCGWRTLLDGHADQIREHVAQSVARATQLLVLQHLAVA